MRIRWLLNLVVFILFALNSSFHVPVLIEKKPSATVKIRVTNMVKNYKIALHDSAYVNPFGETYTITKLRYYISAVALEVNKKFFYEKENFHLVDESDPDSQVFSFSVPAGNYRSLRFLLGVDSLHNVSGAQSGDLDPAKDMFWTWNSGYVMAKLEGNSPASPLVNHKYEFHIGGFSGQYNVLKNIVLPFPGEKSHEFTANKTMEIDVVADINAWWNTTNDIQISSHANVTAPGKRALAVADNYAQMFHVTKIAELP
jgi:hypothetical protein